MRITRDVISDLWPIYTSGEASEATKKIVEDYLQSDLEFATLLNNLSTEQPAKLHFATTESARELGSVRRTRKQLGIRELLFGAAIFLSLCPFTAFKTSWGSGWVLRDYPILAMVFAVGALALWGLYFRFRRKLESTEW
jgi:hypothetical protein